MQCSIVLVSLVTCKEVIVGDFSLEKKEEKKKKEAYPVTQTPKY